MSIAVFNLGISNLTSVLNVLDYIGAKYYLAGEKSDLNNASKILLPGVGTFASGMKAINQSGFLEITQQLVLEKQIPIFGICLGMQLLFESSEESSGVKGISLLKGDIVKIPDNPNYHIPRIGWAESIFTKDFLGFKANDKSDFYYIHSYHACPKEKEIIAITSENESIVSAINKGNIYGCQFHPEKSHIHGIELIKAFVKL